MGRRAKLYAGWLAVVRAFRDAEKSHPQRAVQGRHFLGMLYTLED